MHHFMIKQKRSVRLALVWLAAFVLVSCSAPEDDNPGYCRLSCSSTSLAAQDFTLAVNVKPADWKCDQGDVGKLINVVASYVFSSSVDTISGGGSSVNRSGIAYDVKYSGNAKYIETTPAGNKDESSHLGVITPQAEWCSDSCGIATINVTSTCRVDVDGTLSLMLTSGAATSQAVSWTMTKPEPPK